QAVRLDVQLPAGLDDRGRDGVVAAAGAKGRDRAFIVAAGEADRVAGQRGVGEFGLGQVGHADLFAASAAPTGVPMAPAIALAMEAAVIGVPSQCSTGGSRAGSMPNWSTSRVRSWPSRFCSTTNTDSWDSMKPRTELAKG